MIDSYNDSTGSRKKFLIPLVVLLLCAVSLTGAGYAYNTSVTNVDNTVIVDGTTIGLYKSDGVTAVDSPIIAFEFKNYTYTTNGRAVDYHGGVGFSAFEAPATEPAGTAAYTAGTSDLDDFADGFYVQTTYKNGTGAETAAGFHPVAAATDIDTAAEVAALAIAPETKGVVALDSYKLIVGNATNAAVNVTFQGTYDAAPTLPAGVRDILVTFTATLSDSTTVDKVVSVKADAASSTIATLAAAVTDATITVNTYIIVSDVWAAEQPDLAYVSANLTLFFGTEVAA